MFSRKIFTWIGFFVLGFALGAVFFSSYSRVQGDESNLTEFTVVERATTDIVTDTGEEGDSVGDVLTFANEVYDEANETLLGTDQGYCVRVVVGVSWECNWTLTLENGSITVEGPFYDTSESVLAVTGGTGDYANVTGQMLLRAHDDTGTSFDFVYQVAVHNE